MLAPRTRIQCLGWEDEKSPLSHVQWIDSPLVGVNEKGKDLDISLPLYFR
jgi:hypothetical protein